MPGIEASAHWRCIESHGYIPHVVSRHKEARYEKLERSFMALNHIAAAIIAFRKVKLTVNIIYG
jgi:hypothetical protein